MYFEYNESSKHYPICIHNVGMRDPPDVIFHYNHHNASLISKFKSVKIYNILCMKVD
jgi:hypothetical protein